MRSFVQSNRRNTFHMTFSPNTDELVKRNSHYANQGHDDQLKV